MLDILKTDLGICPSVSGMKLDWLTISFRESLNVKADHLLKKVCELTESNFDEWELSTTGVMPGYNRSYRYHNDSYISINYHDTLTKQGVNLNISGLGTLIIGDEAIIKIIAYAISMDAHFTRLDVAFDDVDKKLPLDVIKEIEKRFRDEDDKYYNLGFSSISSLKSLKFFYQGDRKYKYRGLSMSIGSRYSNGMVRIYNKAVEQKITDKYWYRLELQTKYEIAERLAKSLFTNNLLETYLDILGTYFRPVDFTSKNSIESQIKTNKEWEKFLEFVMESNITSLNSYLRK